MLLLLACHPETAPADSAPVDTTPPAPLVWTDCGEGTECVDVPVPLRHDEPDAGTLAIHVRRLPSPETENRVLWYIDGGPGDAGTRLVPALAFFQDYLPGTTIVSLDHRGVGQSAPLTCSNPEDLAVCHSELEAAGVRLDAYTTTQAAWDLATVLDAMDAGHTTTVWGASYGSFLVNRYLQIEPAQVDAVVVDGLVPPDWTFAEFDGGMDEVGRAYLALCDEDSVCATHLGGDAVATTRRVLDELDATPCGDVDADLARAILGVLLLVADDRAAIPAVVARLDRCEPTDEAALEVLLAGLPTDDAQNVPILANIGVSELWPATGPTPTQADAARAELVVATGVTAFFARAAEVWPAYQPEVVAAFATPAMPVLLLHGGLDPTVPLERARAFLSAYPEGQPVTPPGAGHVTLNTSDCAGGAYLAFLTDPHTPIGTNCAAEAFVEDFDLSPTRSMRLFGTEDPWG